VLFFWEQVSNVLTVDVIKKYKPYNSWSDENREKKIAEIKDYVDKVLENKAKYS